MSSNNVKSDNIEVIRNFTMKCLREFLKDFNLLVDKDEEIETDYYWVSLEIHDPKTLSFPTNYTIEYSFLLTEFTEIITNDKFQDLHSELDRYDLYNPQKNLLNPHFSIFGSLVISYVRLMTEHVRGEKIESKFPIEIDEKVFDKCWNSVEPWLLKIPIFLRFKYILLNCNVSETSFYIDSEQRYNFVTPTKEDKVNLVNELRIEPSSFEGFHKITSRIGSIANSGGWIEGKIEITHEMLEKGIWHIDLIHPLHIEEAFALLGYPNVSVGFIPINNPLYYFKINVQPPIDELNGVVILSPATQYPPILELATFPLLQDNIDLNQEEKEFLSIYLNLRGQVPSDSLEKLSFRRLFRALRSNIISDIILETVIGIESLVVAEDRDLSLQFRLNTSWLIGKNPQDRIKVDRFCKTLYGIRSKIVHKGGKRSTIMKETKKIGGLKKAKELSTDLLRLIILRILLTRDNKMHFVKTEKLKKILGRVRLGEELEIQTNKIYNDLYENFLMKLSSL